MSYLFLAFLAPAFLLLLSSQFLQASLLLLTALCYLTPTVAGIQDVAFTVAGMSCCCFYCCWHVKMLLLLWLACHDVAFTVAGMS